MRPCMGTACLAVVPNDEEETGLACERQFGGRNEPLTRFGPALVSSRPATGCCYPGFLRLGSELDTVASGRT